MKLECLECGKRFTRRHTATRCPGCGGSDIDIAGDELVRQIVASRSAVQTVLFPTTTGRLGVH